MMRREHINGLLDGMLRPTFVEDMAYIAGAIFKGQKKYGMPMPTKAEHIKRMNEYVERVCRSGE